MVAKWNNLPVPKKGKLRSVLKRPAPSKTKDWEKVPYVRGSEASPLLRHGRCKWKRSLTEILTASPASLVAMLREDGLLHSWEGSTCPHCQEGTLGKLMAGGLKHRCSSRKCHKFVNPHQNHPLFANHWGSSSTPLATQAALLLLLLNRIPHAAVHRLLHINHKTIEDMSKRLGQLRESWVVKAEKKIRFGTGVKWADVEADEATFDKKMEKGQLHWEQWCGIVQRGKPDTLVLHRPKPPASKLRAPGPGAVRKVEWEIVAARSANHSPYRFCQKLCHQCLWSPARPSRTQEEESQSEREVQVGGSDVCADPQAQGSWQQDVCKGEVRHPNSSTAAGAI